MTIHKNTLRRSAYAAAGDIDTARREWLIGAQLQDPIAYNLLRGSYASGPPPAVARRPVGQSLESASLRPTEPGQNYLLGVIYYRIKYGRESPIELVLR